MATRRPSTSQSQQVLSPDQATAYKVQIAMDSSPHAAVIIEHLSLILDPKKVDLGLVYNALPSPKPDQEFRQFDNEAQAQLDQVMLEQLDRSAQILSSQGFYVTSKQLLHTVMPSEDEMLHFLQEHPSDVLLLCFEESLPKHKHWRITSTAYAMATHSPCSVLVMKRPIIKAPVKILFATDGSESAEKAAYELMRFLPPDQVEITIIYVISVNYYTLPLVEPYVQYGPLEHALQGQANEMLNYTRQLFVDAGFKVSEAYFNLGDPADQILQESERKPMDLIAMGSHGLTRGFPQWLLGSVTTNVLQYSQCSIAIMR